MALSGRRLGWRGIWYGGFALLFFVIAGEEISWGQRILGIETPESFAAHNVQQEINLHNIEGIHGSIRALALIVIITVCILIPIANRLIPNLREWFHENHFPVFPAWAIGITVLGILFMAIPRFCWNEIVFNLDEMGELYLGVGFLLFACSQSLYSTIKR